MKISLQLTDLKLEVRIPVRNRDLQRAMVNRDSRLKPNEASAAPCQRRDDYLHFDLVHGGGGALWPNFRLIAHEMGGHETFADICIQFLPFAGPVGRRGRDVLVVGVAAVIGIGRVEGSGGGTVDGGAGVGVVGRAGGQAGQLCVFAARSRKRWCRWMLHLSECECGGRVGPRGAV